MGVGTVALIVGISCLLVSLAFIIGTVGSKYIDVSFEGGDFFCLKKLAHKIRYSF